MNTTEKNQIITITSLTDYCNFLGLLFNLQNKDKERLKQLLLYYNDRAFDVMSNEFKTYTFVNMKDIWGIENEQVYHNLLTKWRKKGLILRYGKEDIINPNLFPQDWTIKCNIKND